MRRGKKTLTRSSVFLPKRAESIFYSLLHLYYYYLLLPCGGDMLLIFDIDRFYLKGYFHADLSEATDGRG